MFSAPTREATVERFIGALTMALGVGALIPRNGFGLYAMLEENGTRGWWSMLLLTAGCWLIATSYLDKRSRLRLFVFSAVTLFWLAIVYQFMNAHMWGAALQGAVILSFAADTLCRLIYAAVKKT